MDHAVSRLLAHERIRAARHHIERTDELTLARQTALSAIPAPTGAEGRRAARVAELFREIGLSDVTVDHIGNVHGWFGRNGEVSAPVVLAAHLDTVFGADVDVAVERRGHRLSPASKSTNVFAGHRLRRSSSRVTSFPGSAIKSMRIRNGLS